MAKMFELRFLVTRGEYERAKLEAKLSGHRYLSGYFRSRVFGLGFQTEQMIKESNEILKRLEIKLLDKQPKSKYRTITSRNNIQEPATESL